MPLSLTSPFKNAQSHFKTACKMGHTQVDPTICYRNSQNHDLSSDFTPNKTQAMYTTPDNSIVFYYFVLQFLPISYQLSIIFMILNVLCIKVMPPHYTLRSGQLRNARRGQRLLQCPSESHTKQPSIFLGIKNLFSLLQNFFPICLCVI